MLLLLSIKHFLRGKKHHSRGKQKIWILGLILVFELMKGNQQGIFVARGLDCSTSKIKGPHYMLS